MPDEKNAKGGIELDVIDISSLVPAKAQPDETEPSQEPVAVAGGGESGPKPRPRHEVTTSSSHFLPALIVTALAALCIIAIVWQRSHSQLPLIGDAALPKQLQDIVLQVESTSNRFFSLTRELDTMTNNVQTTQKIDQILKFLAQTESVMRQYQTAIGKIAAYSRANKQIMNSNGLAYLIDVADFYQGTVHGEYIRQMNTYLETLKKYLTYYRAKYDAVIRKQQPQIHSYESLYFQYKTAFGKYEQADFALKKAIEQLVNRHPRTVALFPQEKQPSIFSWTR